MGKILLRQLILLPLLINSIRSHNIFMLHVYKYTHFSTIKQITSYTITYMNNIESTQTAAAQEFQRIARGNIRLLVAFYKPKQEILAAALKIKQPSLSRKLNGKADWMPADIANVADFFGIPFYVLLTTDKLAAYLVPGESNYQPRQHVEADNAISLSTRYQVQHNVAPDNAESRELAGAAGPRYIVRPDDAENTKKRGANNSPRAIVMPYDPDFLVPSVGLEPTLRRF